MTSNDSRSPSAVLLGATHRQEVAKPSNPEPALKESLNTIIHCVKQNEGVPLDQVNNNRPAAVSTAIKAMMGNPAYKGNIEALQNCQKSKNKVARLIVAAGKNPGRALAASYLVGDSRTERKAFMERWRKQAGETKTVGDTESARAQLERTYRQEGVTPTVNITANNVSPETAAAILSAVQREAVAKRLAQQAPANSRGKANGHQGTDARATTSAVART